MTLIDLPVTNMGYRRCLLSNRFIVLRLMPHAEASLCLGSPIRNRSTISRTSESLWGLCCRNEPLTLDSTPPGSSFLSPSRSFAARPAWVPGDQDGSSNDALPPPGQRLCGISIKLTTEAHSCKPNGQRADMSASRYAAGHGAQADGRRQHLRRSLEGVPRP